MFYCKNYTCPKLMLFQWYIWKFLPSIKLLPKEKMHTWEQFPILIIHPFSLEHTYIHIWMMQSYCLRNETFIHSLSLSPPWNEFQNLYLKLDIANTWCRWMDEICEGNRWNEMGLSHKMICFPFSLTSYHQVKWWYTWPFQLIVT